MRRTLTLRMGQTRAVPIGRREFARELGHRSKVESLDGCVDAEICKGIAAASLMMRYAELLDLGIQSEGRPDIGNGSKPSSHRACCNVKPPASESSCTVPVSVKYTFSLQAS